MDAVITTHTEASRRQPLDIELKPQTARRIRQLLAERNGFKKQAEYMQRVAIMLIPLVPKQVVASVLKEAKGETGNVRSK